MYHLLQLSQAHERMVRNAAFCLHYGVPECHRGVAQEPSALIYEALKSRARWSFSGPQPSTRQRRKPAPEAGRRSPHPPPAYFTIAYTFPMRVCERITL